jgi:Tol biopolymer transport system component
MKEGYANCISYWTPDNKGIVYASDDNPEKKGKIYVIDIATKKKKLLPTPAGLNAADPHIVGGMLAYSGTRPGRSPVIRMMKLDGSGDRQISAIPEAQSYGEFDPKISPDGTKVAFMRFGKKRAGGAVDIIVVDTKTGREVNVSGAGNTKMDGLPEWSSDGKRLVYWHIDSQNFLNSGLYTISPEGRSCKAIDLPIGFLYSSTAFFPGMGSGNDAKIVFSGRRLPAPVRQKLQAAQKVLKRTKGM